MRSEVRTGWPVSAETTSKVGGTARNVLAEEADGQAAIGQRLGEADEAAAGGQIDAVEGGGGEAGGLGFGLLPVGGRGHFGQGSLGTRCTEGKQAGSVWGRNRAAVYWSM